MTSNTLRKYLSKNIKKRIVMPPPPDVSVSSFSDYYQVVLVLNFTG